jgi:hypothetical protein
MSISSNNCLAMLTHLLKKYKIKIYIFYRFMSFDIAFFDAYLSLRGNSFFLFCNKFFTFFYFKAKPQENTHHINYQVQTQPFFFKKKDIIP